jgi:hypothetical protein
VYDFLVFSAKQFCNAFAQIEQYCLGAEPAAPDSAKNDSNEGNEEQEKQHNPKNKIEFPYPDNRTENIKLECWNVKPERTLALDDKKWQASQRDGLQDFNSSSVWFPQNGKLLTWGELLFPQAFQKGSHLADFF